jgi:leucyl aminopeptidase
LQVRIDNTAPERTEAGLLCIGLCDGEELPAWLASAAGAADVRSTFRRLTVLRPGAPERVLVVGLGGRADLTPERARVAAALGVRQAQLYELETMAWAVPGGDAKYAAAIAGASIMASFRFDELKSGAAPKPEETPRRGPERLLLHGVDDERAEEFVRVSAAAAEGTNRARRLQSLPANIADPEFLAERAREIAAAHEQLEAEVLGGETIRELGMGGLAAVGAGSAKEPLLIVLRYSPRADGETLAIVGKGVTFDTGGISLKPPASMVTMKFDMSGAAAALEATAAIAELGIQLNLLCVVPAVENMPDAKATRPGDVITQLNGKTVEVNNTDAEGRLILADALTWAARQGADRMVDVATLTGAVVTALGSTYAAVAGNDDELAAAVVGAGDIVGELAWRMPMHAEYRELMDGTYADLVNSSPKRKAGSLTAAAFLEEFVEGKPWAHIDIAGTASDVGRPYLGSGPSGYGVRLLVELARGLASG